MTSPMQGNGKLLDLRESFPKEIVPLVLFSRMENKEVVCLSVIFTASPLFSLACWKSESSGIPIVGVTRFSLSFKPTDIS